MTGAAGAGCITTVGVLVLSVMLVPAKRPALPEFAPLLAPHVLVVVVLPESRWLLSVRVRALLSVVVVVFVVTFAAGAIGA